MEVNSVDIEEALFLEKMAEFEREDAIAREQIQELMASADETYQKVFTMIDCSKRDEILQKKKQARERVDELVDLLDKYNERSSRGSKAKFQRITAHFEHYSSLAFAMTRLSGRCSSRNRRIGSTSPTQLDLLSSARRAATRHLRSSGSDPTVRLSATSPACV
ncbi:unnamed protein product, partial [Nesidiocoris tenuis]